MQRLFTTTRQQLTRCSRTKAIRTYSSSSGSKFELNNLPPDWKTYAAAGGAVLVGAYLFSSPKKQEHKELTSDDKFAKYTKSFGGKEEVEKKQSPAEIAAAEELEASKPMRDRMAVFVRKMQGKIVDALDNLEIQAAQELGVAPKLFRRDEWIRAEGGNGLSCVLQDGNVFEKAGVLVSAVHGPASAELIKQMRARKKEGLADESGVYHMFVAGCSMVLHPHNPHAPTAHLNYRYFELTKEGEDKPVASWFGGGSDLTPAYLYEEDAVHFHKTIKDVCDAHDVEYYPKFKKWADEYFYIPHRKETRGIGGIFFDDLEHGDANKRFKFVEQCGLTFNDQYIPIMEKRWNAPFTAEEKKWQQLRRGRYAEFNLVVDRGTKFGLVTPGVRIESVMASLPLTARWEYQHSPVPGSRESQLLEVTQSPRNWV
ncbi:Coproporphyrinogen III oxidase [Obelidium mucronatum]|nr:Coproporphyrinogen III oxidase [Obelidium mucronatum]